MIHRLGFASEAEPAYSTNDPLSGVRKCLSSASPYFLHTWKISCCGRLVEPKLGVDFPLVMS